MWRTASLLVICGVAVANGLSTDGMPLWRQLLCPVLAAAGYLQGRRLPVPRAWPAFAAAAAAGASFAVYDVFEAEAALGVLAVFVALPWLAGRYRGQQAELVEVGARRIADLERERAYVAERARLRERDRIAADLHDALGHELALIALRAGALELDATLPERSRAAATSLREAAVTATDRLRHTLSLLRTDAPDPSEPAEESLDALISRARTAGMTITVEPAAPATPPPGGAPSADGPDDTLDGVVGRAVHRVAQEALTNAARHAPGAPVTVRLERGPDAVALTVSNPLTAAAPVPDGAGPLDGGSGLAGLRERVRLLGGTLTAGPGDGTFTVTARLPTTEVPA